LISVVLYGRNDCYGYNLHKRAAISLNCIAEMLDDADDEILFVDCNTADDAPTFPQAIADTITAKARRLLRVFRLRPSAYTRFGRGSPLSTLEPLSRNIAVRRSNARNRWVLSSNADMVFVVRDGKQSLSQIAAALPDGFYELPRFEVPEALWETLDRSNPQAVLQQLRVWGETLGLNVAVRSRPEVLFDNPGDFQLMLRGQIFAIHGFNEEMTRGCHVDANLAKRLHLLNGKTESLLDKVFGYHCDHTRQRTPLHSSGGRTENSLREFCGEVSTPFLPGQAEIWGMAQEPVEEIRLLHESAFVHAANACLALSPLALSWEDSYPGTYNHALLYDSRRAALFLANQLSTLRAGEAIGYVGANADLLALLTKFLRHLGQSGRLLVDESVFFSADASRRGALPPEAEVVPAARVAAASAVIVVDGGMTHLPQTRAGCGVTVPAATTEAERFARALCRSFLVCIREEGSRLRKSEPPRQFLLVGCGDTWLDFLAARFLDMTLTPFASHVRNCLLARPKGLRKWAQPIFWRLHMAACSGAMTARIYGVLARLSARAARSAPLLRHRWL
jgi:hypothetical protein